MIGLIVFRPDTTKTVDWAFKTYLPLDNFDVGNTGTPVPFTNWSPMSGHANHIWYSG